MARIERILADLFGFVFLLLSFFVAVEAIARKLFNVSLQGADELGGYALAVGSTLSFTLAVIGRNHIRVDVLHELLPHRVQALLNWLSSVMLAGLAILIVTICLAVVNDSIAYKSTAPTPWATPLIWPQSIWYAGMIGFAVCAVGYAVRATLLFASGRIATLNDMFQPKSTKEELRDELADFAERNRASKGSAS
ncbi:MAG TPA: TRAP transporter small permease [Hyphomicrobiaceae bacterium]|nr:TRAP transporter small permease [Hyphomicrobiaceae bacterium]